MLQQLEKYISSNEDLNQGIFGSETLLQVS